MLDEVWNGTHLVSLNKHINLLTWPIWLIMTSGKPDMSNGPCMSKMQIWRDYWHSIKDAAATEKSQSKVTVAVENGATTNYIQYRVEYWTSNKCRTVGNIFSAIWNFQLKLLQLHSAQNQIGLTGEKFYHLINSRMILNTKD